jgi:molybdate transport system ATP-binding protein
MGLDTDARQILNHLLNEIARIGVHLIIADSGADYPTCMTHVLVMDQFKIKSASRLSPTLLSQNSNSASTKLQKGSKSNSLPEKGFPIDFQKEVPCNNFNIAAGFSGLTIKYGEQIILNNINWTIKQGEKWALTGGNGAGKSMLLSVIFADHPQAYANNITLFDRHRGSGETIWDIKERIGYVSPELHFYFEQEISCEDAVLGVLNEHPYNRKSPESWHHQLFDDLLAYYNLSSLKQNSFHSLSTGQQRLMLLLRTLIKNPPLLLLDEPFQGFDAETIEKSKLLLDHFCINRTLVFVSHMANEIPSIVSHSARLENGKILL